MVAVVSGSGLGLFGSSMSILGGAGGSTGVGRGRDQAYVNTTTGNLVIQSRDEFLSALGLDLALVRTYNSQGLLNDDNGDNWRLGVHQRVHALTGTLNTAGSTVIKVFGDGREVVYRYHVARGLYVSTEGDGAHDTLDNTSGTWTWTDGTGRNTETYDSSGQLTQAQDADGHTVSYSYTGLLLTRIVDASGQVTHLDYTGTDLTQVRVVSNFQTQTLTRYSYDSSHRLTQVQVDLSPGDNSVSDGDAYVTTYTYEGSSRRVASITQSDGSSVAFTYELLDGKYRVRTYTDGEGRVTTLTYREAFGTGGGGSSPVNASADEGELSTTQTQSHQLNTSALTSSTASWAAAALLENSQTDVAANPSVAFDNQGNGLAVWAQGSAVFVRRYTAANNTWATAVAVDSGSGAVYVPSLAIDGTTGNAIVAWLQDDGTSNSVYASMYNASNGTWNVAQLLENSPSEVSEALGAVPLTASIDGAYAAVAWVQHDGTRDDVYLAKFEGGSWSTPDLLESSNEAAMLPRVAVDESGNVTVLWRQSEGSVNRIHAKRWNNGTNSYTSTITLDAEGGRTPRLAFDDDGNGIAVWRDGPGLVARRFDATTSTWGATIVLQSGAVTATSSNLAVDGAGNALVVWVQSDGVVNSVYARRYDAATATWSGTTLVESSSADVSASAELGVAINGDHAVIAWLQGSGNQFDVFAAHRSGTGWGAPQLLETNSQPPDQLVAAIDAVGNSSVIWQQSDGAARSIYQAQFIRPYYVIPAGATWQSIANTLYGVNSVGAGAALQAAMNNVALTTGNRLGSLPTTLDVDATVPAYYTVRSGDTWSSITQAIYGTTDVNAIAALQTAAGSTTTLTPGLQLIVPVTLTYTPSGSHSAPVNSGAVNTSETDAYNLDTGELTQPPGAWSPMTMLENTNVLGATPQTIFDADGNGFAVWAQGDDVIVRRYTLATNSWSAPVTVDSREGDVVSVPAIALDNGTGNASVAWVQSDGTARSVYVSMYNASTGAWGAAQLLENSPGDVSGTVLWDFGGVDVSMNGGYAAVSWLQFDGTQFSVYLARYAGNAWSGPALMESSAQLPMQVSVAVDTYGNTTVVWRQDDPVAGAPSIYVNRWDNTAQAYSGATVIDTANDDSRHPRLAFNANGDGFAVWRQEGNLVTRRYDRATNTWGSLTTLELGSATVGFSDLAIDAAGNAVVAWLQSDGSATSVYVRRYDATTSTWSSLTLLESLPGPVSFPPSVAIRGAHSVVVWSQHNGAREDLYAARYTGGSWTLPQLLEAESGDAVHASVAIDASGQSTVVWRQAESGTQSIASARFSFPTPYFTVPSGATWQTIANTLYGVSSAAAASALQEALGNPALTPGTQLIGLPVNLSVTTSVPAYYIVRPGDTWASITEAIYGTTDANAVSALQAALGSQALTAGTHIAVPSPLNYSASGGTGGDEVIYLETDVQDALSLETRYVTDTAGRLIRVLSPTVGGSRLETLYAYDVDGNVVSVTEDQSGLNRVTAMSYDANGNLLSTRDSLGNTVTRTYNANSQVLTETQYLVRDPDGAGSAQPSVPLTTRFVYDAANRLRFTISAHGRVIEHRYSTAAGSVGLRVATLTYKEALYSATDFDETDLIDWADEQDGSMLERMNYAYDWRGNLTSVSAYTTTDTAGEGAGTPSITRFIYDQRGQLLQTLEARGSSGPPDPNEPNTPYATTYTYDGLGRVLSTTQWISGSTLLTNLNSYDDANRRTTTTLANGLVTTAVYNRAGELTSVIQGTAGALGTTTYAYDAGGRLRIQTDPTGVRQFYFYDDAGRRTAQIDGDGTLTELIYNRTGELIKTVQYASLLGGTTLASLVDSQGQPTAVTLATVRMEAGTDPGDDRITRNVYNAAGQLVYSIDEIGAVTQFFYDGAGRVTDEVRFANTVTISRSIDEVLDGSFTLTSSIHDRRTRHFYDADGQLLGTLDAAGYLVEYRYDPAGHLLEQIAYATRTNASSWAAGTLQQLRPASDNETASTPERDVVSRFFYDGQGRRVGVLDAEGYLTETVYDAAGHVVEVTRYDQSLGFQSGDTVHQLRARVPGSAIRHTTAFAYDGVGRVVQEILTRGTATVRSSVQTTYTYDAAGNLLSTTLAAGTGDARTTEARYDFLGRVVQELTAEGRALINGGSTPTEIEDIWNRYGVTYAYDDAGRRISATVRPSDTQTNTTLFFYDNDGRLRYEVNALGEVKESRYDAFGRLTDSVAYTNRISTASLIGGLIPAPLTTRVLAAANAASDAHTRLAYTLRGEVASTLTAEAASTTHTYNAFGDETIRLQQLNTTQTLRHDYGYDKRGQLTLTHWDPAGLSTTETYEYDAFGRLTSTTDSNGNVRERQYDALGRTIVMTDGLNAERTTAYDAFGRTLTMTDALGNETTYAYNDAEREVAVTTPEGVVVTTRSNRHGQTLSVTAAGNTTVYGYNLNGQLIGVSDDLGTLESRTYDRAGRQLTTTDARSVITTFSYDAANRVLTRIVDSASGGLALTTTYTYDGQGRNFTVTDAQGVVTQTTYDRDGRVTEVAIDPGDLNIRTTYEYDHAGRVITVTEGADSENPRVTQHIYDSLGRRTREIVDPAGLALTTEYQYDANGNLISKIDAKDHRTIYVYDAENRLRFVIDAERGLTETVYDANGRVSKSVRYGGYINAQLPPPDEITVAHVIAAPRRYDGAVHIDRTEQYVYDADGRQVFTIDAMGGVTRKEYDDAGRVVREVMYSQRIAVVTYTDVAQVEGALALVDDQDVANDRESRTIYDVRGRARYSINGLGGVVAHEYDAAGNLTAKTEFATAFSGSAQPTLAQLDAWGVTNTQTQDRVTRMWYDAANRLRFTLDAEGYLHELRYDAVGRVTTDLLYAQKPTLGTNASIQAVQNEAVRVTNTLRDQSTSTLYDAAGRISRVIDATGAFDAFTYDEVGNRLTFTNKKGATWTYVYDANRRMVEEQSPEVEITTVSNVGPIDEGYGGFDYELISSTATGSIITRIEYDALGNVISRTEAYGRSDERTTYYYYDALGRQIEVMFPSIQVYDRARDPTTVGGPPIRSFFENPDTPIATTRYDALGNAVLSRDIGGGYTQRVYDELGRVRYVIDAERYVTEYRYDTFGNQTEMTRYGRPIDEFGAYPYGQWIDPADFPELHFPEPRLDRTVRTEYDRLNRISRVIQPEVTVFLPNAGQAGGRFINASPTTVNDYDAHGQLIRQSQLVDPTLGLWARTYNYYDERGNITAQVDALGYLTKFEYDAAGNRTRTIEYARALPPGSWNSEGHGTPIVTTPGTSPNDVAGYDRIDDCDYDQLNRKIAERRVNVVQSQLSGSTSPANQESTYGYDAVGNLTRVTDANGASTYTYYDALGRQIATAAPARDRGDGTFLTPMTHMRRDAFGNLVEQIVYAQGASSATEAGFLVNSNAADQHTRLLVDSHNRVLQTADPTGANRFASYNERGDLMREWQPVFDAALGTERHSVTISDYDRLSRLTSTYEYGSHGGSGFITRFEYDAFGKILRKISAYSEAYGREEQFSYDAGGRTFLTNSGDSDIDIWRYRFFDLAGRVTAEWRSQDLDLSSLQPEEIQEFASRTMRTETRYDLLGRIVEQRSPDFAPASPDSELQVIAAQFRVDNIVGPSNPEAVYRVTFEEHDFGFGPLHTFPSPSLDPGASVAEGGGYYYVAPTLSNPLGGWVQDTSYQLVPSRYLHWARPAEFIYYVGPQAMSISFEYRTHGSSGAWTSLGVVALPNGEVGVDIGALTTGAFDYRVTYTRTNQLSPYALATGTITIGASSSTVVDTTSATLAGENITPTSIVVDVPINDEFRNSQFRIGSFSHLNPIDNLVYRRVVTGGLVNFVADRFASVSEGGGYFRTASGYVLDPNYQRSTSHFVRWNAPSAAGLVASFEYRAYGSAGWIGSTPDQLSGGVYSVPVGLLADGNYEYRAIYRTTDGTQVAVANGVFRMEEPIRSEEVTLTPDPKDDAGTVAPIGNRPPGSNAITTQIVASAGFNGLDPNGLLFTGPNDVLITFPSISGAVRIELEYLTRAVSAEDHSGPNGLGWPAESRRISLLVSNASAAAAGLHLIWNDPAAPADGGGISQITRVRVYSVDGSEQATLRHATHSDDAASIGGTTLSWDAPWNTAVQATFNYRAPGQAAWQQLAVTRSNGDFSVDVQNLTAGIWEYEVIYQQDGLERARSTGTFVKSGGSVRNVFENPGSGPYPIEPVGPVAGSVTSNVEFTIVGSAEQIVTGSSYDIVNGEMQNHRPLATAWDEENEVTLTWADVGSGSVRVVIDYTSADRYSYNYVTSNPPHWEETAAYVPGVRTSRTFDLSGSAATGTTLIWDAETGDVGGIKAVHRVRVYTLVAGSWVLRHDRDAAAPRGGTSLYWPSPDNEAVDASFRVRQVGTTTWQTITVGSSASGLQFVNLDALAAGNYEYEITYSITESSVTTVTALTTGEFTIAAPVAGTPQSRTVIVTQHNAAFDRGANDFGPVRWDGSEVSWTRAPETGDTVVLRTRAIGTTAWQEQTITGAGPNYTGPAAVAANQALEFEILYTRASESTPYARSRGTLNRNVVSQATPAVVTVTQTHTFQSPLLGIERVENTLGVLSWSTPELPSSFVVFRFQLPNGNWQTLTALRGEDGYSVDQALLPAGTYRYEIRYQQFVNTRPYAYASGVMTVGGDAAGGGVSITDLTPYVRSTVQDIDSSVPTQTQTFDRWGNVLSVTNALGHTTNYRYNQLGALIETRSPEVQVVDTSGGTVTSNLERPVTENHYDLSGRLIATRDANGNVNRVTYNAGGQIISETHADGGVKRYVYDAFGNQVQITDELGFRTRNLYDAANRLTTMEREIVIGGLGTATGSVANHYEYDEAGRRILETDGEGYSISYGYDSFGNLVRRTTARGFDTRFEYDWAGRKISEHDANGLWSGWWYDFRGRLVEHQDFGGVTTRYEYNHAGLMTRQTSSAGQDLRYEYDSAEHLIRIIDNGVAQRGSGVVSSSKLTEYGYDLAGRRIIERTTVDNSLQQDTRITFDALGRMTRVQDPDFVVNYSYDAAGNRTRIEGTYQNHHGYGVVNQQTQDSWYTYDEMNRVLITQGVYSGGIIDVTTSQGTELEYNLKGERISARTFGEHLTVRDLFLENGIFPIYEQQSGLFTERYGYDGLGRLVWTEQDTPATALDVVTGSVINVITNVRTNTRVYDKASREILNQTYALNGVNSSMSLTLTARSTSYDADGRTTEQATRKNGILQFRVVYGDAVFVPEQIVPVASREVRTYVAMTQGRLRLRTGSTASSWGATLALITWRSRHEGIPDGYVRIPAHWRGLGYDGAGVLHGYKVEVYREHDGKYLYATDHEFMYRRGDTYQLLSERTQSYTTVHNIAIPGMGATTRTYNVNGELVQYTDSRDADKNRYFANDAQGRTLLAIQGNFDGRDGRLSADQAFGNAQARTGNLVKAQYFFTANGESIGSFGQLQDSEGAFKGNFDVNHTAISPTYPAAVPSEVIVLADDTLRTIAARIFGDASLWYLLAEENGLTDPDAALEEGMQLRVPNIVLSNTGSTFKPFDVRDAIGDTTPTQPVIMPKKKRDFWDFLAQVFVIAVVIIATFYTAGVLSSTAGGISGGLGANVAAGAAALSSGTVGLGTAVIAAAAGSVVGQGAAIAFGLQEGFSWDAVAVAALSAGLLQGTGVGSLFGSNPSFAQVALQGGVNNAVNQGANILLGLQESFDWREVAIAAATASSSREATKYANRALSRVTNNPWLVQQGSHMIGGLTNQEVRRALGGRVDTSAVVADAFGNALGNSIVDGMTPRPVTRSNEIGITDEQWAQADQLLSADIAAGQRQFNDQLQRDLRQQQFQVSLQRDIERSLNNDPQFVANVPVPRAEFNVPIASPRPDPYLATARAQVGDFWRDGVREASYSGVDRQFADAFDGLLARPAGAPPRAVPGQEISDALYLAGPIPIARHDLGIASLTVNGTLNFVNGVANAGLNALGVLAEPLDRYQGELTSIETGLGPMGAAAVAPTLLLGRLSSAIRAEGALNARFLSNGRLALESDKAALAQKISFEPSLTMVDRYFGMQAGEIVAVDPTARAFYTRLQAQGTDIRFVNDASLEAMGVFDGYRNSVTVNLAEHSTAQEVVSTLIHEGTHQSRFFRGARLGTQYEEYVAFRNEALFNLGRRPTLVERQVIWKDVQHLYPELPSGPVPFGGQR